MITVGTLLTLKLILDDLFQKVSRFVFDFTEVDYIDSSGIGLLVNFQKRLLEKQGSIVLFGCNEKIQDFFHVSKLDNFITILSNRSEVEAHFHLL
jgi:anti-sigma B factor antagonist